MSDDVLVHEGPPDANRGYFAEPHPSLGRVHMYADTPGVYFIRKSKNCIQVSEKDAAVAGFDVKTIGKERDMQEKVAAFEAELREGKEKITAEFNDGKVRPNSESALVLPDHRLITNRNAHGEPRGTKYFRMEYAGGGGIWSVLTIPQDPAIPPELVAEKLGKREAFDVMIERTEQLLADKEEDAPAKTEEPASAEAAVSGASG